MDLEGWQADSDYACPASYTKTGFRTAGHQPSDHCIAHKHAIADQAPGAYTYTYPVLLAAL